MKQENRIMDIFNKPKIIGICGDVNSGKSNLIYYVIHSLKAAGDFKLYTYGLRNKIKEAKKIHSVNEMERIKNSILIVDEMFSLFDLDNRKVKGQIEKTLRLINHNNNILVLCGVGENFKKFISGKVDIMMYLKITFDDLINGSKVKNVLKQYKGIEAGTTLLDLRPDQTLLYDGLHYTLFDVPYMKEYDSKAANKEIVVKNVHKNVQEKKVI